jgi:hypothetical protein
MVRLADGVGIPRDRGTGMTRYTCERMRAIEGGTIEGAARTFCPARGTEEIRAQRRVPIALPADRFGCDRRQLRGIHRDPARQWCDVRRTLPVHGPAGGGEVIERI